MLAIELVLSNNFLTLIDILKLYCLRKNYLNKFKYCLESGILDKPNNNKLINILCKNIYLQKLDIFFCNTFTFKTFRIISKKLINLKYLTINNSKVYDSALHIISNNCKNLEFISLNNCKHITDNGIKILARDCKKIYTISLDCCNITNNSLRYISRYLPNISNISFCCCYSITDIGLIYLANKCKLLTNIYLIDTYITDFGLYNILLNCKFIQYLDLLYCSMVTDETVYSFYKLEYLIDLHLGNITYVTDYSIQNIFNKCKMLENLTIYKCDTITDLSFKLLNKNSCKLINLNLSYCSKITDKSLKNICKYCYTLQSINLKSTNITDLSAKYIAEDCIFINDINLENTNITNIGLKNICLYCDLLKKLNLSRCKNISYKGIRYIFYYCKNLIYLSIYKYEKIRSHHFNNKICKYLQYVYIDNMDPVKLHKIK